MCNCSTNTLCDLFGIIAYISQKLASCVAAALTVSCLTLTLLIAIGLGVGIGYNYCVVEVKTKEELRAAEALYYRNQVSKISRTRSKRFKDLPLLQISSYETSLNDSSTLSTLEVKPTMVVPLRHFGLMILIKNLQEKNENVTLELIATSL